MTFLLPYCVISENPSRARLTLCSQIGLTAYHSEASGGLCAVLRGKNLENAPSSFDKSGSALLRAAPSWSLPEPTHYFYVFWRTIPARPVLFPSSVTFLCLALHRVGHLCCLISIELRDSRGFSVIFLCSQAPWVVIALVLIELHRITLIGKHNLVG